MGFCRSGLYGRGFLTGPEDGGGVVTRRLSDVPVTGLGSGRVNSMSFSPCFHMTKSQSFMNDMNCPGPIHARVFTGSRFASIRHGIRLFRPESHCSSAPAEVQTFGCSFRRSACRNWSSPACFSAADVARAVAQLTYIGSGFCDPSVVLVVEVVDRSGPTPTSSLLPSGCSPSFDPSSISVITEATNGISAVGSC